MVRISSALSRDVEMIHTSKYKEENSCSMLILFLNKTPLSSNYVCVPFIMKEIR